jgi:hypothetical protein
MNSKWVVERISELTKDWTLEEWRNFRSLNKYWEVRNNFYKSYFNSNTNKFNNYVEPKWLAWKLEALVEYLN